MNNTDSATDVSARRQYRSLRKVWAVAAAQEDAALLRHPLIQTFPLSQAIAFLLAKQWKRPFPALSPALLASGAPVWGQAPLCLSEMCQLALLWHAAGEIEAARKLAEWLLPLEEALWLWRPERDADGDEQALSFALLRRAAGMPNSLEEPPDDPFFRKLFALAPRIEGVRPPESVYRDNLKNREFGKKAPQNFDSEQVTMAQWQGASGNRNCEVKLMQPKTASSDCLGIFADPCTGLQLFKKGDVLAAFTRSGVASSLGMVRVKDVEIRAFGPQLLPLGDISRFGICRVPDGSALEGWSRCHALPEVWLKMDVADDASRVELKFVGLSPQEPLAIAFYAKAESCQIGHAVYRPKNLQRFQGEADSVLLKGKWGALRIGCSAMHKAQVIPLAGEGGFWEADFLIAFELHPVLSSICFNFS